MKRPLTRSESPALTAGFRRFLYFTAAVNGAAIMIIEILGARMMAPFFGTSHFVWIAQIAITLVALAAGYYVGGNWVDRSPGLGQFFGVLSLAAAWLLLVVFTIEPICFSCLRFRLAAGSLLASILLFFVPLAILAMTGPFLLRLLTQSTLVVGQNAGRLTAISTLGSFLGTGLIGYLLLPYLPNSQSLILTAAVILLPPLWYCAWWRRKPPPLAMVCWIMGLLITAAGLYRHNPLLQANEYTQEIYRGNSPFGQLQVLQNEERRFYLNDFLVQNTYDIKSGQSASLFTYMLHGLARAYLTAINEVLCIGMGVGIVPMQFAREGAQVDVVEINPAVVRVATGFFDCDTNQFRLFIDDGRHYLNQTSRRYDAIVLDAFLETLRHPTS